MKLTNEKIQHESEQEEMFWYYVNKEAEELITEACTMECIFKDADCQGGVVNYEVKEKQVIYRIAEILEKESYDTEDSICVKVLSYIFTYNKNK